MLFFIEQSRHKVIRDCSSLWLFPSSRSWSRNLAKIFHNLATQLLTPYSILRNRIDHGSARARRVQNISHANEIENVITCYHRDLQVSMWSCSHLLFLAEGERNSCKISRLDRRQSIAQEQGAIQVLTLYICVDRHHYYWRLTDTLNDE